MELCRKCKADALIHVARFGNLPKKLECHHEDPEEKPKERCWCDEPTFAYVLAGEKSIKAEFCPVCGKVQKEWGK